MENQYGITITNKYDLFLRDQDPLEILQMQEALKAARKIEKTKKNVTANDKDTKSAKNKQIKAAVVSQEQKVEKVDSVPSLLPKKEDKPRHPKPVKAEENAEPETKLRDKQSNKASSAQQRSKEDASSLSLNSGNRTEFGHFEVRPSDRSGNRERRTRDGFAGDRQDRGIGSGIGGGNRDRPDRTEGRDRPDRGGFGRERRPRGRYMGSRPPRRGGFSDDRQRGSITGEDQERGLFTEGELGGPGFGEHRGFSDGVGDKGGYIDQYERTGIEDAERRPRGFDDQGGFSDQRNYEDRQDRGNFNERRTFESRRNVYGERRNYEDRSDRGSYVERKRRPGGFGEQQDNQSFGHWSEKPGDGEDREIRRGRGGFGRRGRGRGRPAFGRREFDRHGGGNDQGVTRSGEKRDGGGAHNWGTTMDDLEGPSETQPGTDGATWGEQAEAAENQDAAGTSSVKSTDLKEAGAAAEEAAEEEQKVMTLDEWKALQASKRMKPEYNIRKPGEGCNDPQWKKMFILKKKITDEQSEEEEEGEYEEDRHGKSKNVLAIEITFADNPRRGGRGGRRGGGRGGGAGGSGRGYPSDSGGGLRGEMRKSPSRRSERDGGGRRAIRERAPNVADEHDFPSLDKAIPVQ